MKVVVPYMGGLNGLVIGKQILEKLEVSMSGLELFRLRGTVVSRAIKRNGGSWEL